MRGADHLGITVPNMDDAVNFFVKVIGCEASFNLGAFKFNDDWMQVHLNVNPRAEIKRFQMVRCGHGTNFEIFGYAAPKQNSQPPKNSDVGGHHRRSMSMTWTRLWPTSRQTASRCWASRAHLPKDRRLA